MKAGEAEKDLSKELIQFYSAGESRTIAYMVMEHITGTKRIEWNNNENSLLNDDQLQELKKMTERLKAHEPIQYILRTAHFYSLELYVDGAVLIPRPETEELVDWIIKDVKGSGLDVFKKGATEADKTTTLKILDVGTGSGCIALALKNSMPLAEVWGCDNSEEALNVARRNGSELDIRVDFQGIDFLDESQQKFLPTVDIIVSNPPYIPVNEKDSLAPNVTQHEPHKALFAPDAEPLIFYKALARFGKKRLYEGGVIYVEIHEDYGAAVVELFKSEGYTTVELRKDMQEKDRMIKAILITI